MPSIATTPSTHCHPHPKCLAQCHCIPRGCNGGGGGVPGERRPLQNGVVAWTADPRRAGSLGSRLLLPRPIHTPRLLGPLCPRSPSHPSTLPFLQPLPRPDDEDWVTRMTPPPLDLSPRGEVRPAPQLASCVTLSTSPDLSDQLSHLKIGVTSAPTLPGCWRREGPQSCTQHSTQGPNPSCQMQSHLWDNHKVSVNQVS